MSNSDTDIAALISLITLLIADNVKDNDELNVLANVIVSIGDSLSAIASQRQLCDSLKK